ncbi:hypothetical protein IV203_005305 [Nitzschia inconspicua]|uniref:Uncharacterized protein n=1 Tax=Nitzschia inconspicua TaxID=303405 RepID=A0A9K3KM35_9STRA|nr:hypothetical protein IV203_005305 [Nitzschia inconspicua]
MGNIVYSLIWMALLVFVVWPIAWFLSAVWIILQPFEACFNIVVTINQYIEKFVLWPRDMGQAISSGQSSCPAPA